MSDSSIDLKGKTLVVPIVSTANVSQLATDLLIASLRFRRVKVLNPEFLIPVIGAREDGEPGVTTPLELFGSENSNIVIMQQRSPALKDHKQGFVDYLLKFAQDSGFAALLFLSGVNPTNRSDTQMQVPTYHIIPPNGPELAPTSLKSLKQLPIPVYTFPAERDLMNEGRVADEGPVQFIPGGGLTRRILQSLPNDWKVPTAALLQFVMEGDNRGDARLFAAVTAKVVGIEIETWREPSSWRQGLFGNSHDQTLYG